MYLDKFERCVLKVKSRQPKSCKSKKWKGKGCYNPWAICTKLVGRKSKRKSRSKTTKRKSKRKSKSKSTKRKSKRKSKSKSKTTKRKSKSKRKSKRKSARKSKSSSKSSRRCEKSYLKKYISRPGPPYPAQDCKNKTKSGNDGEVYRSSPNKNGIFTWKKI